jgi:hypothetical protein
VRTDERKFEDRGTAQIQAAMIEREKEMVKKLVRQGKLNQDNYLVKDGSLEYRLSKTDKDDEKSFQTFKQNYNWVIGLSKSFNPEACFDKGKANPGFIADLPLYNRTPVAYFGSDKEPLPLQCGNYGCETRAERELPSTEYSRLKRYSYGMMS